MSPQAATVNVPSIKKAAILLLSVNEEVAAEILSQLDKRTVESVSQEIARIGTITAEERQGVIEEFYQLNVARQYVQQGGMDYARKLLSRSLSGSDADAMVKNVEHALYAAPFSFAHNAEAQHLLTFIQDEHPQTIALVLSHLDSKQAADVLSGLPQRKQVDVVRRLATMGTTNPDIIREVEGTLQRRMADVVNQRFEKSGGVDSVAGILNLSDRSTEKGILETLEEESPELVEEIRRLMFVFEDIMLVDDRGVQQVLKEIDTTDLSLALKTASDELKEKIFRNMSERAAGMLKEEMEYMGPVRLSEVESAQQKIADVVRRLEEAGELIVQGRGGEEEVVV